MSDATVPTIVRIIPQLLVTDLPAACAYYRDILGFEIEFQYGDPLFYSGIGRGGAHLHLKHVDEPDPGIAHRKAGEHMAAYVEVENIDALHAELVARGATITDPLGDKPWQMREFVLEDLEGNILYFGQQL